MEHTPVKYGYARESTNNKKQDISYQIKFLKDHGVEEENIYKEYASGSKEDRIEYNKLLKLLKPGDSLYSTEISRLSRSTRQLIDLIEFVKDNHLQLVIGGFEVDCRKDDIDPMVKGMLQMMGVIAELERNIISGRVKDGLANAENVGRPAFSIKNIPDKFFKIYDTQYTTGLISKVDFCKILGVSRPTLDKYLEFMKKKNNSN